jgi:methylmalonyl-CoA/ethylmalonyl-CoA epimerase
MEFYREVTFYFLPTGSHAHQPSDNFERKGAERMKILKIDHLGIAVNSLDDGAKFWTDVMGLKLHGTETVEEQKVTTAFFPVGESEVELLVSTAPDGPIAKFIEKNGGKGGFQHVAFQVENIEEALAELQEKGVALIDKTPRMGAGGCKIAFLHPKATGGILVEISQRM